LHGSDIDEKTNPYEADLSWVVSPGKENYVGWPAIKELGSSPPGTVRRGLVLDEGIPRHGFEIFSPDFARVGSVTSGTFSPILRKGIALCKVQNASSDIGVGVEVEVRGFKHPGKITKPPFYNESLYGWKRVSKDN